MSFSPVDGEFYQIMLKEIEQRLLSLEDQVTHGACQSWDDYRYRIGQLKALRDMSEWAVWANRKSLGIPEKQ